MNIKDFWEDIHAQADITYLTGSGWKSFIENLLIQEQFTAARTILNMGVGFGYWEKYCVEHGKIVDSLDIAETAKKCVEGISRNFYTDPQQLPSDEYDLITELLVAQHLLPEDLEQHICSAIYSLKLNGTYALQTADLTSIYLEVIPDYSPEHIQVGGACYPIAWVDKIVRRNGGQIVQMNLNGVFPQWNSMWHIYKIQKMI